MTAATRGPSPAAVGDVFARSLPHYLRHPYSHSGHLVEIGVVVADGRPGVVDHDSLPEDPVVIGTARRRPGTPAHETAHSLRAALEQRGFVRHKPGASAWSDWYVLPLEAVDNLLAQFSGAAA